MANMTFGVNIIPKDNTVSLGTSQNKWKINGVDDPKLTDTTYSNATTSTAGLMSMEDKTKLDNAKSYEIIGPEDMVSVSDAMEAKAIKVLVNIEPVQSGSGDPSPTNVRPISGWTGVNVVVSPTTDAQNGTTYPITFPSEAGAVYGGTLDVTTGMLTVTHACAIVGDLPISTNLTIGTYSCMMGFTLNNISTTVAYDQKHGAISNMGIEYPAYYGVNRTTDEGSANVDFAIASNTLLAVYDSDLSLTTETFMEKYGGMQVIYPLATPQTYQLTPTEVEMLLGDNNVWANTGDITVGYLREDSFGTGEAIADIKNALTKTLVKNDIANNLTTTTTGKVLDAIQGKVLNDTKLDKDFNFTAATLPYSNLEKLALRGTDGNNYYTTIGELASQIGGSGGGISQTALVHYVKNCGTISSLNWTNPTIDNNITENMVVLKAELTNPAAQTSDWTCTTTNGYVTISGTINGSTDVLLYFGVSLSTAPSIIVNLASNNPANVLTTNPSPGVMGVLGTAHGGTGINAQNIADLQSQLGITPGYLNVQNTTGTSSYPNDIPTGLRMDLKLGSDIGLSGTYYLVLSIKGWPDTSIDVQQVALGSNGIFWRRSSGNSWTYFQQSIMSESGVLEYLYNDAPYGSGVDITNYTSNRYTFPYDGYIMISSEGSSSGIIRVAIMSVSEGVKPYMYMNVTDVYQIQSLFVKKGMTAFVVANTTSAGKVFYWPLTQYTP